MTTNNSNAYYTSTGGVGVGSGGLNNYGGNSGYTLTMPSGGGQYTPQYGAAPAPPTAALGQHQHQQQQPGGGQFNIPPFTLQENTNNTNNPRRSMSDESASNSLRGSMNDISNDTTNNNSNNNMYGGDYGNYYNAGGNNNGGSTIGGVNYALNPSSTTMNNSATTGGNNYNNNTAAAPPQAATANNNTTNTTTTAGGGGVGDLDYCDALLLGGMDDPSFGWLAGAFGGTAAAAAPAPVQQQNNNRNGYNATTAYNNNTNNFGGSHRGHNNMNAATMSVGAGFGGEQLALPGISSQQQHQQQPHQHSNKLQIGGGGGGGTTALDAFFVAQHQHNFQQQQAVYHQQQQQQQQHQLQQQQQQKQAARKTSNRRTTTTAAASSSSRSRQGIRTRTGSGRNHTTTSSSAAAAAATTTSSTQHLPNRASHSSLPSVQIDPLLEKISLTVTAVSLTPLSGNEVVRHVRSKTDDVITRFLPCVDFLVNCQQELRQGLQVAQRSNQLSHTNNRRRRNNTGLLGSGGMTPRQFHTTYVAPLPTRFKRHNESIMSPQHLVEAMNNLQQLVNDSGNSIPAGCDSIKNTFLGGMRENESWGLRKWLSKHGGAGSICNDLEEVMRHVKSLDRGDITTQRLAGMLRPIAQQAFERLKKDVPAAYQEQSSAHPYLPFFHRLESCLKLMATYDPEEDDVICLDLDSSDDDEDVEIKVVVGSKGTSRSGGKKAGSKGGGAKGNKKGGSGSAASKKSGKCSPVAARADSSAVMKKQHPSVKGSSSSSSSRNASANAAASSRSRGRKGASAAAVAAAARPSPVKPQKRKSDDESMDWGKLDESKRSRRNSPNINNDELFAQQTAKVVKEEPEIICLVDSSDEDENDTTGNNALRTLTAVAATVVGNNKKSPSLLYNEGSSSMDANMLGLTSLTPPLQQQRQQQQQQQNQSDFEFGQTILQRQLAAAQQKHYGQGVARKKNEATRTTTTVVGGGGGGGGSQQQQQQQQQQWRCTQCTFLNEAFSTQCVMCNDDESSNDGGVGVGVGCGGGGANDNNVSDELANFLSGSGFLDSVHGGSGNSGGAFSSMNSSRSNSLLRMNSNGGSNNNNNGGMNGASSAPQQQQQQLQYQQQQQQNVNTALQSADVRELQYLIEHITNGGSLPKQAHINCDPFWGTMDTYPKILQLFISILSHRGAYRYLTSMDEQLLMGYPLSSYNSVVRHSTLCFHEIVCALSKSEEAVRCPVLTMRLSNGQLTKSSSIMLNNNNGSSMEDEIFDNNDGSTTTTTMALTSIRHWNMWNGLHLIEAIDLVLLNSIAYYNTTNSNNNGGISNNSSSGGSNSNDEKIIHETEQLRDILWDGVYGILNERLCPEEREEHMPRKRRWDCNFVLKGGGAGSGGR